MNIPTGTTPGGWRRIEADVVERGLIYALCQGSIRGTSAASLISAIHRQPSDWPAPTAQPCWYHPSVSPSRIARPMPLRPTNTIKPIVRSTSSSPSNARRARSQCRSFRSSCADALCRVFELSTPATLPPPTSTTPQVCWFLDQKSRATGFLHVDKRLQASRQTAGLFDFSANIWPSRRTPTHNRASVENSRQLPQRVFTTGQSSRSGCRAIAPYRSIKFSVISSPRGQPLQALHSDLFQRDHNHRIWQWSAVKVLNNPVR